MKDAFRSGKKILARAATFERMWQMRRECKDCGFCKLKPGGMLGDCGAPLPLWALPYRKAGIVEANTIANDCVAFKRKDGD